MISIYKITNTINGKMYIGQTSNTRKRFTQHRNSINRHEDDKRGQGPLYDDMREYGVDKFEIKTLTTCTISESDKWEEYYIKLFNSVEEGYNRTYRAIATNDPDVMTKIQTPEVRVERSKGFTEMNIENWKDPEYRKRKSIESSKLQKERLKDPEYLKEKSEQLKTHWKAKMKRVAQYTLDGEYIRSYEGVRVAERESGIDIHNHLKHPDKRKTAGGFVWKYEE